MTWFKKKELPDDPHIKPRVVERELSKQWDNSAGEHVYVLTERKEFTPHTRVQKVFMGAPIDKGRMVNGEPRVMPIRYTGDRFWAKRISKRYKLPILNDEN